MALNDYVALGQPLVFGRAVLWMGYRCTHLLLLETQTPASWCEVNEGPALFPTFLQQSKPYLANLEMQ